MFNAQIERSSLLNIVIQIKGNNFTKFLLLKEYKEQFLLTRIYVTTVCSAIFVTDKIFDCKRNLSRFCSVAVSSGFSVENESMLTYVIYTV